MVPMSQYGGQLQQEMDSSENTFHVLEPHVPDYSGRNHSTVVAMVLYHPVSLRNMPFAFATDCVPLDLARHLHSVAHLSLQATDGDQDQNIQTTEKIPSQELQTNFFKEKTDFVIMKAKFLDENVDPVIVQALFMEKEDSVIVQARSTEEKADPVLVTQQELEKG